ncbi:hypothetical protein ABZW96_11225 [Nocardia sp. NPDC004168]|uniref:hypothetical protein n=1 Tax=Nocardia sp. NPDC004168 TaxID=3154452 RepID=UPI0033B2D197
MWEWGRTFAEYAAAAAWTRNTETAPKYGEPECWTETTEGEPENDRAGMAARDPLVSWYDLAG